VKNVVYGINYSGASGLTSMFTLDTTFSGPSFLGSQSSGTFTGKSLAPASDNVYGTRCGSQRLFLRPSV
jgi:hypothetical protein